MMNAEGAVSQLDMQTDVYTYIANGDAAKDR